MVSKGFLLLSSSHLSVIKGCRWSWRSRSKVCYQYCNFSLSHLISFYLILSFDTYHYHTLHYFILLPSSYLTSSHWNEFHLCWLVQFIHNLFHLISQPSSALTTILHPNPISEVTPEIETDVTEAPPPTILKLERGYMNFRTNKRSISPVDAEASHCYLLAKDCSLTADPAPLNVWLTASSDMTAEGTERTQAEAKAGAYKSFVVASVITAGLPCRFEMTSTALEVSDSYSLSLSLSLSFTDIFHLYLYLHFYLHLLALVSILTCHLSLLSSYPCLCVYLSCFIWSWLILSSLT